MSGIQSTYVCFIDFNKVFDRFSLTDVIYLLNSWNIIKTIPLGISEKTIMGNIEIIQNQFTTKFLFIYQVTLIKILLNYTGITCTEWYSLHILRIQDHLIMIFLIVTKKFRFYFNGNHKYGVIFLWIEISYTFIGTLVSPNFSSTNDNCSILFKRFCFRMPLASIYLRIFQFFNCTLLFLSVWFQ